MGILQPSSDTIEQAARFIREGELVAFPTETVYGLGGNALDPIAVAKIFEVKNRPHFDPLIVHIADPDMLGFICDISAIEKKLSAAFWPGPLTLVLPKKPVIGDLVTSGLPKVAVRMPNHDIALKLIRAAGVPIAAPSANRFGYLSPTSARHVDKTIGHLISAILDGGPCDVGVESTILDYDGHTWTLLRAGGIATEVLSDWLGEPIRLAIKQANPSSPGQLTQHYSPRTPIVVTTTEHPDSAQQTGYLGFQNPPANPAAYKTIEILSAAGDYREAAARLFAALHHLDEAGLDLIIAEPVPAVGLGAAIMDRLTRAAAK